MGPPFAALKSRRGAGEKLSLESGALEFVRGVLHLGPRGFGVEALGFDASG